MNTVSTGGDRSSYFRRKGGSIKGSELEVDQVREVVVLFERIKAAEYCGIRVSSE